MLTLGRIAILKKSRNKVLEKVWQVRNFCNVKGTKFGVNIESIMKNRENLKQKFHVVQLFHI